MGEKLKKIVPVAAAAAIAMGVGSEAKAAPAGDGGKAKVEHVDTRQSMEQVQQQAQEWLENGQGVNFYQGVVEVDRPDGTKVWIENPVLVSRSHIDPGLITKQERFQINHPDSQYWSVGYIKKDEAGQPKVTMLPINNNGNKMKFYSRPGEVANPDTEAPGYGPGAPIVDFVKYKTDSGVNLNEPLDAFGNPLQSPDGQPIQVGVLTDNPRPLAGGVE